MGRHRDNYNTKQMKDVVSGKRTRASLVEGTPMGRDANSQAPNTCVLIWTEGDASMTFSLSFPPRSSPKARRDDYVTHPIFSTRLGAGTLLIFTPEDDLFFCHEASFERGEARKASSCELLPIPMGSEREARGALRLRASRAFEAKQHGKA